MCAMRMACATFPCPVQASCMSGWVPELEDAYTALAAIAPAVEAMEAAMRACASEDESAAPGPAAVAAWLACVTAMFRGAAELQRLNACGYPPSRAPRG